MGLGIHLGLSYPQGPTNQTLTHNIMHYIEEEAQKLHDCILILILSFYFLFGCWENLSLFTTICTIYTICYSGLFAIQDYSLFTIPVFQMSLLLVLYNTL